VKKSRRLCRSGVGCVVWLKGVFCSFCAGLVWNAPGQVLSGCQLGALPIRAFNVPTAQYDPISIDLGAIPVRGLAADDATRHVYVASGTALYRISYDGDRIPVRIASFHGDATTIDGGLAFDTLRGVLVGSSGTQANHFYEIDPATARATLVLSLGAGDFGGLDFDPSSGVLYAANDSASTGAGLAGRGLYRVNLPLSPASFTRIAQYPVKSGTTVDTDIDGLAVGNGRVYLVADETNWMYVYNLLTGVYETPIAQPWGGDRGSCGASYAASYFLAPQPDIAATLTLPADCSVRIGEQAVFHAAARNAGTTALSGVSLRATLPTGAAFIGSSPAGSLTGSVLTISMPDLAAGQREPATITLAPSAAGLLTLTVTARCNETDSNTSNDTASGGVRVLPARPDAAALTSIASTVPQSTSSILPGGAGERFLHEGPQSFGSLSTSGNGRHVIFSARATGVPGASTVIIGETPGGLVLLGRQGLFPSLPSGGAPLQLEGRPSVNDLGWWAYAGVDSSGPFIARVQDGSASVVARSGAPCPAYAGDVFYGALLTAPCMSDDGSVTFGATLVGPGVSPGTAQALLQHDGFSVLVRTGLDIPFGQRDASGFETFYLVRSLDLESFTAGPSASGARYVVGGELDAPAMVDRVLIREHPFGGPAIAVQESRPIAGIGPVAAAGEPIVSAALTPGGLCAIVRTGGEGWLAIRENAVIAALGEPVTSGMERWAGTLLGVSANQAGDYVVVGETDQTNLLRNSAAVLNGSLILAREGDPIDLDGNGLFDDGTYLAEFIAHRCIVAADRFIAAVRLRSEAAATGCSGDDDAGYALLEAAFEPSTGFCAADFNSDGGIDGGDVEAFFLAWEAAEALSDVNQDGGIDGADVEAFFVLWEAGGCS